MQAKKATPKVFPLTTVAGRIGLLGGLTAGTVTREEVEYNMLVVVPRHTGGEVRFDSITDAAKYLVMCENGITLNRYDYARKMDCMKHRIARYCNADNVEHYYWAE